MGPPPLLRRLHHSMLPSRRHQPQLPLLLLLLLRPITISSFSPATNYLLSCGSSVPSSPPSSTDTRTFLPDLPSGYSSLTFVYDESIPVAAPNSSLSLYSTARVFRLPASYFFPISYPGNHILRLHFYPFSSPSFNLSTARFSVSASSLTLLSSFSTLTTTGANPFLLKEFLLNINIPILTLSFTPLNGSFAFASAIELFSAPSGLVPDSVAQGNDMYNRFASRFFETIYRINIGGYRVDPISDPVWRTWEDDANFLPENSLGEKISTSLGIHYESTGTSTREIAPSPVYQSARVMYRSNALNYSTAKRFNLTWDLRVKSGRTYLVRMHFCDIVSDVLGQFLFSVYLDGQPARTDIDLSINSIEISTPFYNDFVVDAAGSTRLRVDVGPGSPPKIPTPTMNGILNGLEVMDLSDGPLVLINPPNSKKGRTGLLVGGIVVGCVTVLSSVTVIVVLLRRKKKPESGIISPSSSTPSGADWSPLLLFTSSSALPGSLPAGNLNDELRIPLTQIRAVTHNFNQSCQVGFGGFGKVYKGLLQDGRGVAVKRATPGSRQGLSEFQTEISVLSSIRHCHLVSFIGYCDEQGEMILVYEFMAKGTLRDHLYNSDNPCLSWKQRLNVCIGAATGIHYLHTGTSQAIIHRDVKSANILLDENFQAKVSDFGLSKLVPLASQDHVSTAVKGSFGYLDPEYFRTQQLTEKSDVFSFGVVLLEVLCARPVIDKRLGDDEVNLADWGLKWQKKGKLEEIVDPRIRGEVEANSLRKFGELVEKCLESYGTNRPSMGDVLWSLDYALKLQEATVHREPHEDSVTIPMVNLPRLTSANTEGWRDGNSVTDVSTESAGSHIFSQIISCEGR